MNGTRTSSATVADYLAALPPDVSKILARIREQILKSVPGAIESISYAIPAYKLDGKPLLYFAAFKGHIGLYPMTGGTKEAFAKELQPYPQSKGTVRIPYGQPVPYALIGRIAKYRAREITAGRPNPPKATARPSAPMPGAAKKRTTASSRAKGKRA